MINPEFKAAEYASGSEHEINVAKRLFV